MEFNTIKSKEFDYLPFLKDKEYCNNILIRAFSINGSVEDRLNNEIFIIKELIFFIKNNFKNYKHSILTSIYKNIDKQLIIPDSIGNKKLICNYDDFINDYIISKRDTSFYNILNNNLSFAKKIENNKYNIKTIYEWLSVNDYDNFINEIMSINKPIYIYKDIR